MRKFCVSIILWNFLFFCNINAFAQILDDAVESIPTLGETSQNPSIDVDESEAMFNDLFSDHDIYEREPDKIKTFDDAVQSTADSLKKSSEITNPTLVRPNMEPISGDLFIGVSKGSFKIFQGAMGQIKCSFGVTLRSELNKELKTLGLRLIYPRRAFAFVFKKVPSNGATEHLITTTGNICYTLSGVPDIEVNLCRIPNTLNSECAKRIKWDANIESPKAKK